MTKRRSATEVGRRGFLKGASLVGAATIAAPLTAAAQTQAPLGTPTIIVSGPKGKVAWDANGKESAVPTLSQLQSLISQVS